MPPTTATLLPLLSLIGLRFEISRLCLCVLSICSVASRDGLRTCGCLRSIVLCGRRRTDGRGRGRRTADDTDGENNDHHLPPPPGPRCSLSFSRTPPPSLLVLPSGTLQSDSASEIINRFLNYPDNADIRSYTESGQKVRGL